MFYIARLAFGSILREVIGEEKIHQNSDSDYETSEISQQVAEEAKQDHHDSDGFFSETCKIQILSVLFQ